MTELTKQLEAMHVAVLARPGRQEHAPKAIRSPIRTTRGNRLFVPRSALATSATVSIASAVDSRFVPA